MFLSTCLAIYCTSDSFTRLPFSTPSLLVMFCAHLTFHFLLSCSTLTVPPYCLIVFVLHHFHSGNFAALMSTEWLPLLRLAMWRFRLESLRSVLFLSPKKYQSNIFEVLWHIVRVNGAKPSGARTNNKLSTNIVRIRLPVAHFGSLIVMLFSNIWFPCDSDAVCAGTCHLGRARREPGISLLAYASRMHRIAASAPSTTRRLSGLQQQA
jgi:hypothetical protein